MRSHPPFAPGPCPYELDDGAYILGALNPTERAEFERHFAVCASCRDSMAQLAVLPGLLGRLDPATAESSASAPPSLLPRVLAAVRAQRAARRRRRILAGVAATVSVAAVATAVGLGVRLADPPPDPISSASVMFRPMSIAGGDPQVDAQIGLAEQRTGTLVTVRCLYHGSPGRGWEIWLVVYPRDEEAESIGSWIAVGGLPTEVSTVTHYPPDEIDRIELRSDTDTLAWWSP